MFFYQVCVEKNWQKEWDNLWSLGDVMPVFQYESHSKVSWSHFRNVYAYSQIKYNDSGLKIANNQWWNCLKIFNYTLSYLKAFGIETQHGPIRRQDKQGTHMGYIKGTSCILMGLSTGYLLQYILENYKVQSNDRILTGVHKPINFVPFMDSGKSEPDSKMIWFSWVT